MKKVLITGGAGFIGYHLVKYVLQNSDASVVIVDNLQRGKRDEYLERLMSTKRVTFLVGDLTDPAFFNILPEDFDVIYHLAAVNGTKNFYKIPDEVLRINIISLFNLLNWLRVYKVKPKVCFTSSNEAYAGALEAFNQLPIPTPENVPLIVSDVYNPRWTYGGSKLIGELMLINYGQSLGIPSIIVRPHNFYGPRAGKDHVIPEFSLKIINKVEPFELFGRDETRSFCYIEDAVEAMYKLMDIDIPLGKVEIYHIGSTEETNIEELANKMFEASLWRPTNIIYKESSQGSVKRRLPDVSKIMKAIDWVPRTTLREGLKKTFSWYKQNYS